MRSRETAVIGSPAPGSTWPKATPAIAERTETSHGRNEWRQAEVVAASEPLMPGHKALDRVTSRRDEAKPLTRLFMASTLLSPDQALDLTRAHWQIENGLRTGCWTSTSTRISAAPERAMPPPIPRSSTASPQTILQLADTGKVPISHRIKKCACNHDYLLHVITHMR